MPYIAQADRDKIDPAVETLAHEMARAISVNASMIPVLRHTLVAVVGAIKKVLQPEFALMLQRPQAYAAANALATNVLNAAVTHGAPGDGTFLGPLNYAITRLLQRIPQIKVERDDWKHEFRYWMSPYVSEALELAVRDTLDWGIGAAGVFRDVLEEYRERVKKPYEYAQAVKNGDCFDTPWHTKAMSLVDARGRRVGYAVAMVERSTDVTGEKEAPYFLRVAEEVSTESEE